MKQLTKEDIFRIALADDLHIAPFRADGITYGTPTWIWNVQVNGNLFVRAYHGTASSWYQSAVREKAGKIVAVGTEFKVRFETEFDEKLNQKIDDAYRQKYGSNSPYLTPDIMKRIRKATIRILSDNINS